MSCRVGAKRALPCSDPRYGGDGSRMGGLGTSHGVNRCRRSGARHAAPVSHPVYRPYNREEGAVACEDWKRYLRRDIEKLQLAIREDLRLVSWGVSHTAGEYALWIDCQWVGERSGTVAVWRGRAPLPRTWARNARDAFCRRGLLLALAQALADIACRSGAGVRLWRNAG